jgi:DNA-directed RNA polymerase subunit RPC12/RpoP
MSEANLSPELQLTARDVLFECPECQKSLAIDESAAGMMIECPQCRVNVIVPNRLTEDERLLLGAANGDDEAVAHALARGANIHSEDVNGHTSLALAKQAGHVHIIRMLWEAGAK